MNSRDLHTSPSDLLWPLANRVEAPERGVVQLWCGVLRFEPEAFAGLERLLSIEERQRASRFRTDELRHRFMVSRGLMRRVLGGGRCLPPDQLRFTTDDHGKPHLVNGRETQFNLSHSRDLMLLAVTRGMPVGVDIEQVRRLKDAHGIAHRFFTARESEWLRGRQGSEVDSAFFSLWTRKEAILKATGEGISSGLETIELLDAGGRFLSSVSHGKQGVWTVQELQPATGFVAALAVPAAAGAVQLHRAACRPG